jgi:hypothetical protein
MNYYFVLVDYGILADHFFDTEKSLVSVFGNIRKEDSLKLPEDIFINNNPKKYIAITEKNVSLKEIRKLEKIFSEKKIGLKILKVSSLTKTTLENL